MTASTQSLSDIDDFLEYIRKAEVPAVSLDSTQKRPFVPEDKLQIYLDKATLRKLLICYNHPATECTAIHSGYWIVFSILITIRRGTYITQFLPHERLGDDYLPFTTDDDLPHECKDFFRDFYEAQWRFCAQRLKKDRLNDTRLHDKRIIPITSLDLLCAGPDSCTYKVEMYPRYQNLLEQVRILLHLILRVYNS
jgi:hypothetical protein